MNEMKLPEISRDTYRKIKKMNRDEIAVAVVKIYLKGYDDGRKFFEDPTESFNTEEVKDNGRTEKSSAD